MPDKTAEQIAEALADSLLAPLRAVGTLLAGEVGTLKTRVTELESDVDALETRATELALATDTRFEELEARIGTISEEL